MAEVDFTIRAQSQADATIARVGEQLRQLSEAERETAASMQQMQAAATKAIPPQFAAQTGAAGAAVQTLRFQLFDVGQALVLGQSPLMILAQQGPQVAQALGQASAAGKGFGASMTAALGPVAALGPALAVGAAAAGFAALAYQGLTAEGEQAAEVQAIITANTGGVKKALDDTSVSVLRYTLAMSGATEEQHAHALAMVRVDAAYKEATASAVALTEANQRLLDREWPDSFAEGIRAISLAYGDMAEAVDRLDGSSDVFKFLTMTVDGLTTSTSELKEQSAAAMGAMVQQRAALLLQAAAAEAAAKAEKDAYGKREAAAKAAAKADQEAARAAKEKARALADAMAAADEELFGGKAMRATSEFERLGNAMESLIPARTLSDAEKLVDYLAQVKEAVGLGRITLEQGAALTATAQARANQALAASPMQPAQTTSTTAATANTVSQALSSPLSAIASTNAIAGAVIAGLQAAGSMEGDRSVFTEAAELVNAATNNLDSFVESALSAVVSIIEQAPVGVVKAVPGIVSALAQMLPEVITALSAAVPDVVVALAEALPQMLPDLIQLVANAFIAAGPMLFTTIAVALVDVFTDPAFYEAIANGFVAGIERMVERFGDLGSNLIPTSAGFAMGGETGNAGQQDVGRQIVVTASDIWSDFTTFLGVEDGAQGRR